VVAPHRAPSIDPALRAFLAECLDGTDVDGDIGEVRSVDVPDLPRALSFDDADVDLSGICAWLEGDVGLATNDDDDARALASTTPRASSTSKKRAPPGSLEHDSVRAPPARTSGDKRGRRGAPATPPRRDELTDRGSVEYSDPNSVEYSDPNSDPSSVETNSEGVDPSKEARLRRNRASAALSRQRKRLELVHLRRRCVELERAVAHFQYVAQCASAENVDLRRRLVDGVTDEVAGSNPVVAAVNPVTRLPIPRMAPVHSSTTRGRRTGAADTGAGHADIDGGDRGGALSGAPTGTGRLGEEPFGADDAAYTLCDMPRVESRRRRGAASRSRRRVECGVWCRPTQLAHGWRGCRRAERGGRETRLRATGSVPNAPRRSPSSPSTSPPRRPPGPCAPRLLSHRTPK